MQRGFERTDFCPYWWGSANAKKKSSEERRFVNRYQPSGVSAQRSNNEFHPLLYAPCRALYDIFHEA